MLSRSALFVNMEDAAIARRCKRGAKRRECKKAKNQGEVRPVDKRHNDRRVAKPCFRKGDTIDTDSGQHNYIVNASTVCQVQSPTTIVFVLLSRYGKFQKMVWQVLHNLS